MSRLEETKEKYNIKNARYVRTVSSVDLKWLIDRVEELERLSLSLCSKKQSYKRALEVIQLNNGDKT